MTPLPERDGAPTPSRAGGQRTLLALAVLGILIVIALLLGPCAGLLGNRSQSAVPGTKVLILAPDGFSLRGTATGVLRPGVSTAVAVRIVNPLDFALEVLSVSMTVQAVHAPGADALHPCSVQDFAVVPYSGPWPLTVAGGAQRTLADLRVPIGQWPRVVMANRPVNQDGCKNASLTLGFTGTSTRALY